jgi:hypothetical protein
MDSIKFLLSWVFDLFRHASLFEAIMYVVYAYIGYRIVKYIILEIID